MNISVCIDAVLRGRPLGESLEAIHSIGIDTFEFWSWWDKDLNVIKAKKEELGLNVLAFCTKFVSLVDPSARNAYIQGLEESIEAAQFLGCPSLITQTGNDNGYPREVQRKCIIDGLKACVPLLEKTGISLLVEPLNVLIDHPGHFLSRSSEAFSIIEEVGSPNVKLLFDIYHQQVTEGNLIPNITENLKLIGHFHAAGHPGRSELDSGELYYPAICQAIEDAGYNGYMGLEYFPKDEPLEGMKYALGMKGF
ncbi:TIM barrel protein [Paenibacillus oenotherae]|uniref:TIM barrel protein n=1 Tax=Paenibacillus oenotherae TaxID=1435645 RepID=A0ABS7D8W0_9BACL|nr:TIM barrel protein [Paenibacillus oenotherae]MBW7476311.1 TIM barrel protein [Paenibacillus oenotherae]